MHLKLLRNIGVQSSFISFNDQQVAMNIFDEEKFNEHIFITLENIDYTSGNLLIDFINLDHFFRFENLLDHNISNRLKTESTMIIVKNSKFDKRLLEDRYYILNKETLIQFSKEILLHEDSHIVKYIIDFKLTEISQLISSLKGSADYVKDQTYFKSSPIQESFLNRLDKRFESVKLVIRKVGQGSWNEFLINDQPKIIFDIGTCYKTPKSTVEAMVSERDNDYQLSKPIVIISHWDVDHYHLLLGADDNTIKAITFLIYRSEIPNATSRKVIARFNALNPEALLPVDANIPDKKKSIKSLELLIKFGNSFNIYNGMKNRNRNKSGLLLSYNCIKTSVICGADFHYSQINSCVLPNLNYKHNHFLIVPHHGGEAGKRTYDANKAVFQDAIISVGKNSYRHPFHEVKDDLKALKFKVVDLRTTPSHYMLVLK